MPTAVRAALLLEDPQHVSGSVEVQLQLITYTLIKKKKGLYLEMNPSCG